MSDFGTLNKRRKEFFTSHLASCLDVLAYTQLIIIYLHDTSFIRLVAGSVLQLVFLGPKELEVLKSAKKQILIVLLFYNTTCILLHTLLEPPKPATGTYLHGGLTIEFIGTPALSSRWWLVVWSLVLLCLQLTQYAFRFPAENKNMTSLPSSEADAEGAQGNEETPEEFAERGSRNDALSGHLLVMDIAISSALIEGWNQEFIRRPVVGEAGEAGEAGEGVEGVGEAGAHGSETV